VASWFQYHDPHNYYHLSQNDMKDMSSTCQAVDNALKYQVYTFDEFLSLLKVLDGDTAAALEQVNQEILSPSEWIGAIVGTIILLIIAVYSCFVTYKRFQRYQRREQERISRVENPSRSRRTTMDGIHRDFKRRAIMNEVNRTFTGASSADASEDSSNSGRSRNEPLISQESYIGESFDNTQESFDIPERANTFDILPRANDGSAVKQEPQKVLKIVSPVEKPHQVPRADPPASVSYSEQKNSMIKKLLFMTNKKGAKAHNKKNVKVEANQDDDSIFLGISA
jgi:hypothetical protein